MRKHVRISPASENLLRRFVGAVIADLLARKSRGKVNPETGRLEVADVGIVLDTGEKALVWVRAFDIVPKLEGLLLEITTDFAIPQWPGGPLTEWESISSKVLGFSQSRVTSIGILERFYDKET